MASSREFDQFHISDMQWFQVTYNSVDLAWELNETSRGFRSQRNPKIKILLLVLADPENLAEAEPKLKEH